MNPSTQAIDLLDEFIEDLIAETPPRVYARIAAALGIAVEEVEEVLMLFAWAHYLAWWARAHRHRADGRENQSLQTEAVSAGSSDL